MRICIVLVVASITIIFAMLLVGCFGLNSPPNIIDVQQLFENNYGNISAVAEFIANTNYENIYILEANGIMKADFIDIKIQNHDVVNAIKQLLGDGIYKSISKRGNTIVFLQWKGLRDIGCGIAYTINGAEPPKIDYMTQYAPLTKDNWYYYISDYNSWDKRQGMGGQGDGSVVPSPKR